MPLARLLTGHGAPVSEHRRLVQARLRDHRRRCDHILAVLVDGPRTAFEIAGGLWPQRTVTEQTLLVVWEVIGHLELLLAAGTVEERIGETGSVFALTAPGRAAPRPAALRRRPRRRPVRDCAGAR
jgi:hypothetical protein